MAIKIPDTLKKARKNRKGDGKINTEVEMIDAEEERLWEHNPLEALKYERIEKRRFLNWLSRFTISICNGLVFIVLLYLLFYLDVKDTSRDLVNILVGAYVAVLAKSTDYWFKDKEDAEDKESAALNGNGDT
tara:strand:+ start:280 stop:675 length:396 start_codon:yes stop_codon:yes gene_type:complete